MSKLFGLDWQDYDYKRIQMLMLVDTEIKQLETERIKESNRKR